MPEITRLNAHKSILESKKGMIAFVRSNTEKIEDGFLIIERKLEAFVFQTKVPGSYPTFRHFTVGQETASIIMKIWMVKVDSYESITEEKFDEIVAAIEADI